MLEVAIRKQRRDLSVAAEFALPEGASLGLFGPSGAGKSTVLNCIAGLEPPDAGSITLDGETWFPPPLAVHRRRVGYLSQQPCLFPHLTVAANVTFAGGASSAWLDELRARLALDTCWDASVHKLSGGQARRVALARMLLRRPPLVLLDEPFAGLDRANVRAMLEALQAWRAAIGFTLIAVDHQPDVLEQMTGAVIWMDQGRASAPQTWQSLRSNSEPSLQALLEPLQPPIRTIARSGL
ncbi:MAG: ATP-binding cassette domain-containing protein [Acidobacteria bacterium]|nr:MAG: ATP-binding cassette domain-containing protein [Acidobacteriota bacterium]